jgi:hypothetical protein
MHGSGLPYFTTLLTVSVIKENISTEPGFYSVRKVLIRPIIISVIIIRVYTINDILLWALKKHTESEEQCQ